VKLGSFFEIVVEACFVIVNLLKYKKEAIASSRLVLSYGLERTIADDDESRWPDDETIRL